MYFYDIYSRLPTAGWYEMKEEEWNEYLKWKSTVVIVKSCVG